MRLGSLLAACQGVTYPFPIGLSYGTLHEVTRVSQRVAPLLPVAAFLGGTLGVPRLRCWRSVKSEPSWA